MSSGSQPLLPAGPALRHRPLRAALLVLLLLAAQALALVHGVVHGPGHDAGDHPSALFDDHAADGAQCRLIDALAQVHATAPAARAWLGYAAIDVARLPAAIAWRPGYAPRAHRARGPPAA